MADRRPGNVGTCAYRGSVDIELILDAVGTQVPGLRELARRFLEADAAHLGVPLDLASVIAGRAEGAPEVHVTAAADELVKHLAAQPEGARVGLAGRRRRRG